MSNRKKKIVIIGAGIIGLFSAYYLSEEDFEITILDKTDGEDGCSMGNAGMIVPSHFIPLASPGMIEKGMKWMLDAESPFYVKPRLNLELLKWGISFYKSAKQSHIDKAKFALRDLSFLSKICYQQLSKSKEFEFGFEEKGLLMLCKSAHGFEEECQAAEIANSIGINANVLKLNEIHQLEPELKPDVMGGIYYPGDAHLYPNQLVSNLKSFLEKKGVKFIYNTEVVAIESNVEKVTAIKVIQKANNETLNLACDELILATGSWSQQVAQMLKLSLPMQAGKGYSITKNQKEGKTIHIPTILLEARVAITPMGQNLVRFGGTMEIGGINSQINMNRVRGIVKSVPEFYPNYELQMPDKQEVWYGLRPCSPDGMPYIGRSKKFKNLSVATGHAMMGLSLAPATGKLISEIILEQKPELNLGMFEVDRF
ncbi:MAG: FAD-dependent oxidoreductase [Bacteroidota bacterium]